MKDKCIILTGKDAKRFINRDLTPVPKEEYERARKIYNELMHKKEN
jgi:hypothetical protein